jgi:hypothetical protein
MAKWNQADKASPNLRPRLGLLSKPPTPQQQLQGGLFRRRDLLDRRSFDVGLFALFIGLVQELIDDANTSLLRFLVFGQEFVIYFPAH